MQLIKAYRKSLRIRNYRPATLSKHIQLAALFLNSINEIKTITSVDVEHYLEALQDRGRTIKTIKNHLTAIKVFCDYLMMHGIIRDNPANRMISLSMPEEIPVCLTDQEIKTAYSVAHKNSMICEVTLALKTGMRVSELRMLKWQDVDLENKQIIVRKSKGKRPRTVPLHKDAINQLEIQSKKYGHLVYVFPGGTGGPGLKHHWNLAMPRGINWWSRKSIKPLQVAINTISEIPIGSTCRGWHALRHTFATHAIKAGIDIVTVRDWMGHKKIETTMKYVHVARHYDERIELI